MAIHNIERCRDGCRTSLLIAGVVALQWVCYAVFTGYNTHTKVKKERHRKSEFGSSI